MDLDTKIQEEVDVILSRAKDDNDADRTLVLDLVTFCTYGHQVLSQFGMGLCGFSIRHNRTSVLMTIKSLEGDTPLVAFITSGSTTGCVSKFLDLLYENRVKWQRDKYPWI